MTAEREIQGFAKLIEALRPWLDGVIIVGGWAHRLFRYHPLARIPQYPPLMTLDADVALPVAVSFSDQNLRERLVACGFHEDFVGNDRPPVTHYQLGGDDQGFFVEFLTPLSGSEVKRNRRRDVTTTIAGITAQKLRYIDVLLIEPWSVDFKIGRYSETPPPKVKIANPVTYIVQKLLTGGKRKPHEQAKDVLYIHDTLELFSVSISELSRIWKDHVGPQLGADIRMKKPAAGSLNCHLSPGSRMGGIPEFR